MKVYAQQKPSIIMEGSKGFAHFGGELRAYAENGKVNIVRQIHDDDIVEWQKDHATITDSEGVGFGNLEETVDAINSIFNTEYNEIYTNTYNIAINLGYTGSIEQWVVKYNTNIVKSILKILF